MCDERRLRCRGGDGPPSHQPPSQGALFRPCGREQPGVPEREEHGAGPAAGLQHDGAAEESVHDPTESSEDTTHIYINT